MDNHRQLPPGTTLQDLKKEAKALQEAHWNHDPSIVQRLRDELSDYRELPYKDIFRRVLSLTDAQWVIAREYGFRNWKRVQSHLANLESGQTTSADTDEESDASDPSEEQAGPPDQATEPKPRPDNDSADEAETDPK